MLDQATRQVHLTEKGERRIHEVTRQFGGVWSGIRRREELVSQALSAVFLYTIDRHYLVSDDKVMIIDENTGRIMPDRSWERGLHQMIEIKEKCKVTGPRENIARLTYQRFFRRYLRLAGMTGTAQEVRRELWSVYRLPVLRIPTNKPSRRKSAGCHVFPTKNEKWQAVLSLINTLHQQGCPILIGTGSVADSEHLSNLLTGIQLEHQVLNARQDAHEAEIISKSGQNRAITVATNMAGRGTDIPLSRDVASQGGLYVIATETNDARRIDRQLFGRCGRQGDPGRYQSLLSCEDELIRRNVSSLPRNFLSKVLHHDLGIAQRIAYLLIRYAQAVQEGKNRNLRHDLLQQEEQLGKILAFSGRME